MAGGDLSPAEVLVLIPQQPPFRFIDAIHEIDDEHVVASYRYREDEFFYRGHFPDDPVTPGAILVETIAQAGVLALGLYLMAQTMPAAALRRLMIVFTEVEAEFHRVVRPGDTVTVEARKLYFRRAKLRVAATLRRGDGQLACSGTFAGMCVGVT